MTQTNPLRVPLTTTGKELASVIMEAGAHIKIQQQLARDLAKLLVNSGDDTISALKELLSQPDPKGILKSTLRNKADDHLEDWATGTPEDFAHWIRSANVCFHDVSDLLRKMGEKRDGLTGQVVQGLRHYRESPNNYTEAQMRDFALIAAAAEYAVLEASRETDMIIDGSINSHEQLSTIKGHDHFYCCPLASHTIEEMVINHPEETAEIINVIVKHRVYTEEAILHCLNGGHSSLVNGAI
jgi:hypothetical protein